MRKVKIESWKSKVPVRDTEGKITGTEDADENLLMALNVLMASKKPEEVLRGIDQFRAMNRIAKAFDKADKSKILVLEETDYKFLKNELEKNVPSQWGMNDNLMKAVEAFLGAEAEEVK